MSWAKVIKTNPNAGNDLPNACHPQRLKKHYVVMSSFISCPHAIAVPYSRAPRGPYPYLFLEITLTKHMVFEAKTYSKSNIEGSKKT